MYDSPEELLRQIQLGEDTSLELKEVRFRGDKVAAPNRADLADELAAIANTRDGVLVLGVDDQSRDIPGIPLDRLEVVDRLVFEICNDAIKPPLSFRSFRIELPDQLGDLQPVLKIEVPKSLFVHKSPGGYFYRQGSSKREMPPDILARLFQQRSQARIVRFDEQAVPRTDLSSLDETLWRRFVGERDDPVGTLRKMKILTTDESGEERASVAGVLACSSAPQDWLAGAFVQAVHYRGTRQDSNYQIDAQDIVGPVDVQIREALNFVRKNMRVAARKTPEREEFPQYSLRAAFEAIVNAVAHRDYSIDGSKIRLFLFSDRLELYSPGPLPNTVSVDSLALRQSTRNELLTSLLARCPVGDPAAGDVRRQFLMEKRGDGVPIILHESLELSGRSAEYRVIDDSEVLLTIYAASPPEGADESGES